MSWLRKMILNTIYYLQSSSIDIRELGKDSRYEKHDGCEKGIFFEF